MPSIKEQLERQAGESANALQALKIPSIDPACPVFFFCFRSTECDAPQKSQAIHGDSPEEHHSRAEAVQVLVVERGQQLERLSKTSSELSEAWKGGGGTTDNGRKHDHEFNEKNIKL